jgi:hypothetical protein
LSLSGLGGGYLRPEKGIARPAKLCFGALLRSFGGLESILPVAGRKILSAGDDFSVGFSLRLSLQFRI